MFHTSMLWGIQKGIWLSIRRSQTCVALWRALKARILNLYIGLLHHDILRHPRTEATQTLKVNSHSCSCPSDSRHADFRKIIVGNTAAAEARKIIDAVVFVALIIFHSNLRKCHLLDLRNRLIRQIRWDLVTNWCNDRSDLGLEIYVLPVIMVSWPMLLSSLHLPRPPGDELPHAWCYFQWKSRSKYWNTLTLSSEATPGFLTLARQSSVYENNLKWHAATAHAWRGNCGPSHNVQVARRPRVQRLAVATSRRRHLVESGIPAVVPQAAEAIRRLNRGLALLLQNCRAASPRICLPRLAFQPNQWAD